MQLTRACRCGRKLAYLSFRDNILTPEILTSLYCPECSPEVPWNPACMVEDCGWILEYDIAGARFFMARRGVTGEISPDFLFDEGYLSWQGFSPLDHEVNSDLHQRLAPMIKEDLHRYLEALKSQWLDYVTTLKHRGWRKAQRA
jgi:hypothetical protein